MSTAKKSRRPNHSLHPPVYTYYKRQESQAQFTNDGNDAGILVKYLEGVWATTVSHITFNFQTKQTNQILSHEKYYLKV